VRCAREGRLGSRTTIEYPNYSYRNRRPTSGVQDYSLNFHTLISRTRRAFQQMAMFSDGRSCLRYMRMRVRRPSPNRAPLPALQLKVRAINGQRVFCRPGTTDFSVLYETFCGRYHLPPADLKIRTILDLGSNIGLTIAHYASLYPEARVLGIEMDPGNAEVCRSNIAPYAGRCEVLVAAAWKEDGEISYGGDTEWGFRITPESGGGSCRARAFSVSSLIDQLGTSCVDFVKMDIEGAEREVLADAGKWSGRVRCLKVEVHPPYTVAACVRDLECAGMRCEVQQNHFGCVLAWQPEVWSALRCR
jgi:FkbM family methyltransferase